MIASSCCFLSSSFWFEVAFSNSDLKKVRALGVKVTAALRGMNFRLRLLFRALLWAVDCSFPIPPLNGDDKPEVEAELERSVLELYRRSCPSVEQEAEEAGAEEGDERGQGKSCRPDTALAALDGEHPANLLGPTATKPRRMPCLERIIVESIWARRN